jgi:hypothetical protein
MRLKCNMLFPGKVVEATLVQAPSQASRTDTETRLELVGPPPIQLAPPDAMGAQIVQATPAEWAALKAAGYELSQAT